MKVWRRVKDRGSISTGEAILIGVFIILLLVILRII